MIINNIIVRLRYQFFQISQEMVRKLYWEDDGNQFIWIQKPLNHTI